MRRDPELVRKLILAIEDLPGGTVPHGFTVEGYTDEQVGYHNYLLCDAGLADGVNATTMGETPYWLLNHLNWAGHDFADNLRNETIWKQVRAKIATAGGSVSIEIMIEMAKVAAKKLLGLDD